MKNKALKEDDFARKNIAPNDFAKEPVGDYPPTAKMETPILFHRDE